MCRVGGYLLCAVWAGICCVYRVGGHLLCAGWAFAVYLVGICCA